MEVHGNVVRSHPLAGTTPRTGDPDIDRLAAAELLASEKNQIEHRVVIDMIHDTLLPWCSYLDWEPEPEHRHGRQRAASRHGDGGSPQRPAAERAGTGRGALAHAGPRWVPPGRGTGAHRRADGFPRGRYGGAVGWVDAAGDGTWAVAIRCAELSADRRSARLVAGGGIVADSDPLSELAETQAKLQAMLSAIVRP